MKYNFLNVLHLYLIFKVCLKYAPFILGVMEVKMKMLILYLKHTPLDLILIRVVLIQN